MTWCRLVSHPATVLRLPKTAERPAGQVKAARSVTPGSQQPSAKWWLLGGVRVLYRYCRASALSLTAWDCDFADRCCGDGAWSDKRDEFVASIRALVRFVCVRAWVRVRAYLCTCEHVQRMDRNRLPRQALTYRPEGRRNIGRPKTGWRDQLHFEDWGTGHAPNS